MNLSKEFKGQAEKLAYYWARACDGALQLVKIAKNKDGLYRPLSVSQAFAEICDPSVRIFRECLRREVSFLCKEEAPKLSATQIKGTLAEPLINGNTLFQGVSSGSLVDYVHAKRRLRTRVEELSRAANGNQP